MNFVVNHLGGFLAGGALVGFIIFAVMTTRKNMKSQQDEDLGS